MPKPSRLELAHNYAAKYGKRGSSGGLPLTVTVVLPVGLFVLLVIGFVRWKENTRRQNNKDQVTLLDIKNMREIDNFSSLEHIRDDHLDKCSLHMDNRVWAHFIVIFHSCHK